MLADISHLQEIIDQLCMHTGDPNILPPASEQVILDATGADRLAWSFQVRYRRCYNVHHFGNINAMYSVSSVVME